MKTSCRDNSRSISWVRWASGNIFYVFDVKKTKHCQISSHMLSLIENHFKTLLPFFYLRHLIYRLSFLSFIFYLHHNLCFHGCFPNNSSKWQTLFGNIKPLRFCYFVFLFVCFFFTLLLLPSQYLYIVILVDTDNWIWDEQACLVCGSLWYPRYYNASLIPLFCYFVFQFVILLFCYFVPPIRGANGKHCWATSGALLATNTSTT